MISSSFLRGRFGLVGLVASSLLVLTVVVTDVQAKRGCFAYGHSCLGGLGKRADQAEVSIGDPNVAQAAGIEGRGDIGNSMDVDPMHTARFEPQEGMNWPWLDGRVMDNVEQMPPVGRQLQKLTPQQLYQLSPFLRQLLRSMRINQDLNISDV